MFKPGDIVLVSNPHPENAMFKGQAGVVHKNTLRDAQEMIAVEGLYGKHDRLKRAVRGIPAFESWELTRV